MTHQTFILYNSTHHTHVIQELYMRLIYILIPILLTVLATPACKGRQNALPPGEEPSVIEEGTSPETRDYYVNEDGEIIYNDSRERLEQSADGAEELPTWPMPPLFPGAQRIFPADEDARYRRSFITRAPLDAIEQYYTEYLETGKHGDGEEDAEAQTINSITFRDEDGRRSVTMFLNENQGDRGGMKIMIKEFPAHQSVEIIFTNLTAAPWSSALGYFATPEEVQQWAEEALAAEEERQRHLDEAEGDE